jgi:glycosyltransferase involved in cell wall biosynthesis
VADAGLPSFDLVVATVGRADELARLLESLERQTYDRLRLLVVDQNEDERLAEVLAGRGLDVLHLRAARGLSRARNAALPHLRAEVIGFPDDDCIYPGDLLEGVARRLAAEPSLDGLTGRSADGDGRSSPSWEPAAAGLTRDNLWNRVISYALFLRRPLVERVGAFDEQLGLGAGTPWSSGEEIDYLIRAVDAGARIEYDPALVVVHGPETRGGRALGARDGASIGYLLRKHRYPPRTVATMLARPAGGAVLSVLKNDRARAGFHAATLRGRLLGYRGAAAAVRR